METGEKIFNATHRGYLKIGGTEIPCAVLENKKRIISQTGLFQAFERPRKGEIRQHGLPSIIGAKNLLEFITEELKEKSHPVYYYHTNGKVACGYNAELIPLVCELYLIAKERGVSIQSQERVVLRAGIIVRSLAKTGITALIDEATGYQYDREKDELQKILSSYIREDYMKWQARFPRKFYKEVFRIFNWRYNPLSPSRPGSLGKFTNKYVYEQMPPGVLDELQKKNPVSETGRRRKKHHQFLTEEVGVSHLDKHLTKLITIMELSDNIPSFQKNFNKVFGLLPQHELFTDD